MRPFERHSVLGPGLFESVYEAVLASELEKRGLQVARQQPIPVVYEGTRFEMGFRADLLVEQLEKEQEAATKPITPRSISGLLR